MVIRMMKGGSECDLSSDRRMVRSGKWSRGEVENMDMFGKTYCHTPLTTKCGM